MIEKRQYNPEQVRYYQRVRTVCCPFCDDVIREGNEATVEFDGQVFRTYICPGCDPRKNDE